MHEGRMLHRKLATWAANLFKNPNMSNLRPDIINTVGILAHVIEPTFGDVVEAVRADEAQIETLQSQVATLQKQMTAAQAAITALQK
jgi:hypothetical protein